MSDKREPASGKKANPVPQGLDAAVRSQMVGYFRKALYLMGPLILAGLTGLGAMCWAYIEWRLPQIAGGVPKGAIVAFVQGNCPAKEGWTDFVRARSRVVIGSIPDTEDFWRRLSQASAGSRTKRGNGRICVDESHAS